jgi:GTPase involved in cell partitioning and DNA repair
LEADEKVSSLSRLRKAHFLGNIGENGYIKAQDGKDAKALTIYLPVGTLIYEMVRDENYTYQKKDLR